MQTITSKDNELIKHIRKLKDKKYRDESNEYVVEGVKLVEEAVKENAKIKQIIVCEDTTRTYEIPTHIMLEIAKYECIYVTEKIFTQISDVKAPQGILAIIEKGRKQGQIDYSEDIIIALDGIQDPGNLGTILRTVDSVNLKQIIISYNLSLEKGNDSCHSLLVFLSFRPLQVQSLLLRGITLPRQWKAACCRPDHQSVVLLRQ